MKISPRQENFFISIKLNVISISRLHSACWQENSLISIKLCMSLLDLINHFKFKPSHGWNPQNAWECFTCSTRLHGSPQRLTHFIRLFLPSLGLAWTSLLLFKQWMSELATSGTGYLPRVPAVYSIHRTFLYGFIFPWS